MKHLPVCFSRAQWQYGIFNALLYLSVFFFSFLSFLSFVSRRMERLQKHVKCFMEWVIASSEHGNKGGRKQRFEALNQSHNIHASVSSSVICKDGLGQTDREHTQIHAIVKWIFKGSANTWNLIKIHWQGTLYVWYIWTTPISRQSSRPISSS